MVQSSVRRCVCITFTEAASGVSTFSTMIKSSGQRSLCFLFCFFVICVCVCVILVLLISGEREKGTAVHSGYNRN